MFTGLANATAETGSRYLPVISDAGIRQAAGAGVLSRISAGGSEASPFWKRRIKRSGTAVPCLRYGNVAATAAILRWYDWIPLRREILKAAGAWRREGKIQKMRQAAGFVSGTQISKILRILEHNAVADADEMIGVIYDRKSRKWRVSLQFQGVTHRLGSYNTPAQAAQARRKAEKEWFIPFLEQTIRETSPAAAKKNVPSTST